MRTTTSFLLAFASLAAPAFAQVDWTEHSETFLRTNVRMDYDLRRGRLVTIGGTDGGTTGLASILESADGPWRRVIPLTPGPGAIAGHTLVYDAARGQTVVFGGVTNHASTPSGATWLWDGADWTRGADGPPPRWNAAATYDAGRQRVVLFGGLRPPGVVLDDTWEWDGSTWTQRTPANMPPGRWGHAMAYDAGRGRTVMFAGGYPGAPTIGETWEWDGNVWALRAPAHAPAQRVESAMAYDPARARVVLQGGVGAAGSQQIGAETWEWDGSDWTQRSPGNAIVGYRHALAFDPSLQRVVAYGSYFHAVVHAWDGADWVVDERRSLPFSPAGARLSWDAARGHVLMYGSAGTPGKELWAFDGTGWRMVDSGFRTTGVAPADLAETGWSYDAHRGVHVLFGGRSPFPVDEVWEFDGSRWRQPTPTVRPMPRIGHAMVYDAGRRRVLMFGGETTSPLRPLNDTWEWDGVQWTEHTPAITPSVRRDAAIAYDPRRRRVVLHGGRTYSNAVLGDTWEWDGAAWTEARPQHTPGPRTGASMDWDDARRRCVLVGGVTSDPRAWEWTGADWLPRDVQTTLPPRELMGFAFDPVRGVHVGHGGRVFGTYRPRGDTWLLAPVDPATVTPFGTGCPAGGGHELRARWLPWIDTTLELTADGFAPTASVVVWCGFSNTAYPGGSLPQLLDAIGMPGCELLVAPDVPLSTTSATASLPLPDDPSVVGVTLYFQAFGTAPGANPLGLATTEALAATIGSR